MGQGNEAQMGCGSSNLIQPTAQDESSLAGAATRRRGESSKPGYVRARR